jgi:glucose-1-phosphate thymidylyltransferase
MKGILLSGGLGTRLYPITKVISKQMLPLYDKPMIYYPLSILMLAGIREVLIISTPRDIPAFSELFGDGNSLGMNIDYAIQSSPRGIAEAFIIGEKFISNSTVALILGDNIFYGENIGNILKNMVNIIESQYGAAIFGYYVKQPEQYGVIEFDKMGNVIRILEKPQNPKSHYAVPGLYFYDNNISNIAKTVKPSPRGELEITSINNIYLTEKKLNVERFGRGIAWLDTGTYDTFLEAANFIATIQRRQGLFISCIEEIAFRNKWITENRLLELASTYKNEYGEYLKNIIKES